jgi:hypothetical protein
MSVKNVCRGRRQREMADTDIRPREVGRHAWITKVNLLDHLLVKAFSI